MKPIFDINDGDFLFETSDGIAYDSSGNMMMRIGDNMAMDMEDQTIMVNLEDILFLTV